MKTTNQIADHLRQLHFGGNWTGANLKETLDNMDWRDATKKIGSLHSIATLVFHINFFVDATLYFFEHGKLTAKDQFSFDGPKISSQEHWASFLAKTWDDCEQLAAHIENLEDSVLDEFFFSKENGTYFRCLQGLIEHSHYHLGQIAIIKSILNNDTND